MLIGIEQSDIPGNHETWIIRLRDESAAQKFLSFRKPFEQSLVINCRMTTREAYEMPKWFRLPKNDPVLDNPFGIWPKQYLEAILYRRHAIRKIRKK
jgi:hypothetical protein